MTPQNASNLKISDFKRAASITNKHIATAQNFGLQKAASKAKPLPAKLNLSEEQKTEMVRAYMRSAMRSAMPATVANAPKEGETTIPSVFMGGMTLPLEYQGNIYQVDYTVSFTISGSTISDPTELYNVSDAKYDMWIKPFWGVWCEDYFEGLFGFMGDEDPIYTGYYGYNFLTDELIKMDVSVSGDDASWVAYQTMGAYNPVDKKIYTLLPTQEGVILFSGDPGTGLLTPNETGFVTGFEAGQTPISMAISKEGKVYTITANADGASFLYEVNTTALTATKIGTTIATNCYPHPYQSATFDGRTDKLYWTCVQTKEVDNVLEIDAVKMVEINTETGAGTMVGDLPSLTIGLASVYYTSKYPAAIDDFALTYEFTATTEKVKATFTLPSVDVNGDALTSLTKYDIVRAVYNEETEGFDLVTETSDDAINPGQEVTVELDATGWKGTQWFGVYTTVGEGEDALESLLAEKSVLCSKVTLPYTNGFEDSDALAMAVVSVYPADAAGMERVTTEKHTGDYSYKVTSSMFCVGAAYEGGDEGSSCTTPDNRLSINEIPVKKGGTYTVSFWIKGSAYQTFACLFDRMNSLGFMATIESNDWEEVTMPYTPGSDGEMEVTFAGTNDSPFYIDDIEVKQTGTPARPDVMTIKSVTPASDGSLKATVKVVLPGKTLGGETLTELTKIEFYVAGDPDDLTTATPIIFTTDLTPGTTKDFEITVPKAGKYYLSGLTHNSEGACPFKSGYFQADGETYKATSWIGYDKLPTEVKGIKVTPQTDGKTKLEWNAPVAENKGYLGTITYTIKDGETQLYQGTDRNFTTDVLSLGMHTFTLTFANDKESKNQTILGLGGLSADMMYCNVSYAGSTYESVLNVSSDERFTPGSRNSGMSQMMYPATGKAMYIDNLLLFTTAPTEALATEAKETVKIYMGTTDKDEFDGFIEKDKLTLVYDGDLTFEVGKNTHNLSLKGFYYDGTKNLVISIVKPMQDKTSYKAKAYVCGITPEKNYFVRRNPSTSKEINFDELTIYNSPDLTITPERISVAMMATPAEASALKTLSVTVKKKDDASALKDAVISITRDATKEGKNLTARLTTGADGKAEFAFMPVGNFKIKVQAAGLTAVTRDLEVTADAVSPIALEVEMESANAFSVGGTVADKGGNKLSGVTVKATSEAATFNATTNENGVFNFAAFYSDKYELTFEKAGMEILKKDFDFSSGKADSTIAETYVMTYKVVGVPMAAATVNNDGEAVITWDQPTVSANAFWTTKATRTTRFTYDNKVALKYAQRFLPADLAAMKLGNAPKVVRFGFMPGSTTAQYTIVIAHDTTHEIYRYQVPAQKLVTGEWCEFEVIGKTIDPTKQLWLIVEVAADATGNQDYPIVVEVSTGTNPYDGKGNLMCVNGKWKPLTAYNENIKGNVMVRATLQDESTKTDAANGYKIYRGKTGDKFEKYTLISTQNVKGSRTYTDASYANAPFGLYNYAVVADYYSTDTAKPTYTNILKKDMEFDVTFNITSNAGAGKSKDAYVFMIDTSLNLHAYRATAGADGKATIAKKVWRDVYFYEITLPYHKMVADTLFLTKDTVINISLEEIVVNPEIASTAIEGKNVVMNYGINLHNWVDDVESYEDFAIANLAPWTMNKGAKKLYLDAADITWKNNKAAQSWIVMNPSKADPDLSETWPAYSGNKYFLAMGSTAKSVRHDLLVRPVTKGGGSLSFACMNFLPDVGENFAVVYSSTTADSTEFKPVPNGEVTGFMSDGWEYKSVDIPEDAKYVGIRYASESGKYGFMVDDIIYATEDFASPISYELYLDGTKVKDATVSELSYTFTNLANGEHTVGVKAIYGSGASEMVTKKVTISSEAMPIRLTATVDEKKAVLNWEMPEGFTPQSYKVFLGEEMKADNLTEMTYTFNDLTPGNYTASVVAVYATGESEKATATFKIDPFGKPSDLKVKVNRGSAVLTWTKPEGLTPQSYKVFLGEEVKAEGVTETTYTLNNLATGEYTVGVVAVYKTGESEKVTATFKVTNVGVEDIVEAVRAMVYPNPNNGLFYLQTNGAGEVEVYNLRGQMVVRKAVAAEGIYEIDLQNREKGAYVLRFTGSDRTQTVVKLIVR